ncbi:MAG: PorV/PorQ family protein [Thermotogae bacterium]|nr:PorV/PorQ family protein [Thermotogota bacterium]
MWKKGLAAAVLGLVLVGELRADANKAGAVVLTIYPGAKAIGMGGAFSAIADDPSAVWYNPAALGTLKGGVLYLVHAPWLRTLVESNDSYLEFASLTSSTRFGTFSLALTYLTVGELNVWQGDVDYGTTTPYDVVLTLGYGNRLLSTKLGELYVGGAAKALYSFLIPRSILERMGEDPNSGDAFTVAFDGSVYLRKWPGYSISFGFMNLGPGLRYGNLPPDPLPYSLRVGFGLVPVYDTVNKLQIAFDVHKVAVGITDEYYNGVDIVDEDTTYRVYGLRAILMDAWFHVGVDYTFYNLVSFRIGYFYDRRGLRMGPTFGGAVSYKGFTIDIADDTQIYDFNKQNDIDVKNNLRFGFSYTKRDFKLF